MAPSGSFSGGGAYTTKTTILKTQTFYYNNSGFYQVVDEFESGITNWSGSASTTLTEETTIVGRGDGALKVVTSASAQYVEYDGYSSTDLSDYDDTIIFWVRSLATCTLTASLIDGSSESLSSSTGVSISSTELNRWIKVELTLDTDSGSFDPTDVEKLRISGLPDTSTIYIDHVWNGTTSMDSTFRTLTWTTTEPAGSTILLTLYKDSDDSVITGYEDLSSSSSPLDLSASGITYDFYGKFSKTDTMYPTYQGTVDSLNLSWKPSRLGDHSAPDTVFGVLCSNNEFVENWRDEQFKDVGLTTATWDTSNHYVTLTDPDLSGDIVSEMIYYNPDPTKNVRAINIVPVETIPSGGSITYYVSPDKNTWQTIPKETLTDLTTATDRLYFKIHLERLNTGETITVGDKFKIIMVVE